MMPVLEHAPANVQDHAAVAGHKLGKGSLVMLVRKSFQQPGIRFLGWGHWSDERTQLPNNSTQVPLAHSLLPSRCNHPHHNNDRQKENIAQFFGRIIALVTAQV